MMGIASIIAAAFLALFMLKSSKKYQAYTLQLKEQDKYQEWLERNKAFAVFDKAFIGPGILFVLAFLVSVVDHFITVPKILLMVAGVLTYAFYPCLFITILVYSWLFRKALHDLGKQIDTHKASSS